MLPPGCPQPGVRWALAGADESGGGWRLRCRGSALRPRALRVAARTPRDAGSGAAGADPAPLPLPAAGQPPKPCLGGSGESPFGGSLCESRGARFVRLARAREASNDGGFRGRGAVGHPFFKGLFFRGMLLSTGEIFYTKCKGRRLKSWKSCELYRALVDLDNFSMSGEETKSKVLCYRLRVFDKSPNRGPLLVQAS